MHNGKFRGTMWTFTLVATISTFGDILGLFERVLDIYFTQFSSRKDSAEPSGNSRNGL